MENLGPTGQRRNTPSGGKPSETSSWTKRLARLPQQMNQRLDQVYTQIQQLKVQMAEHFNQAGR